MSCLKEREVISLNIRQKILKRALDFFLSFCLLIFLLLPIFLLFILASIDTRKLGVFTQKRVGKDALFFTIFKIRTINSEGKISKFGAFLRKSKLDELTQIINIFIGDMSFVGPRPDLIGFADKLKGDNRILLSVKPGLTGPASLLFFNEEDLLRKVKNPEEYSSQVLWPKKVELNRRYIENYHIFKDFKYIFKTLIYVIKNMVV